MTRKKNMDAPNAVPMPQTLPPLWRRFRCEWTFVSPVYASTPADPELVEAWLASRQPAVRPPGGKTIDEIQEEVFESLADAEGERPTEYGMLVFQYADLEGERGICLRTDTIRAHWKDCARQISEQYLGRKAKERAFSTRVKNGLYQDPQQAWVPLRRPDGRWVTKPDRELDRAVHTRHGSALKRLQIVDPPSMVSFEFLSMGNSLGQKDLDLVFQYGGVHGYGGERSRDGGKYLHILREITEGG
jgi:hypothetical protein